MPDGAVLSDLPLVEDVASANGDQLYDGKLVTKAGAATAELCNDRCDEVSSGLDAEHQVVFGRLFERGLTDAPTALALGVIQRRHRIQELSVREIVHACTTS